MSSQHYIKVCKDCEIVLGQCRCPGPKEKQFGCCESCSINRKKPETLRKEVYNLREQIVMMTNRLKRVQSQLSETCLHSAPPVWRGNDELHAYKVCPDCDTTL